MITIDPPLPVMEPPHFLSGVTSLPFRGYPAKTKCMLFSTPQMSSYHSLAERPIHLSVGDKPLERVHSIKLLGVHITDTLKRDDHVKHLASSCYSVLAALRKIKNLTNYQLRKHLVEGLVLSRLDFNDIICDPPQEFDAKGESTLTTRLHDTLSVP